MLIENKYKNLYFKIINRARLENRDKKTGYYEKHHIIPKSISSDNSASNLVLLTAREHYLCHKLLIKCVSAEYKKKMFFALWAFNRKSKNQERIIINSRDYEYARKNIAEIFSKDRKGWGASRQVSELQKEKISKRLKGKPKSDLTKERMKDSWKTRGPRSESHCAALSKANRGRVSSAETKNKISAAMKGINPVHTQIKWVCNHCSKEGVGISNFKRWHGLNCKALTNV